MVGFAFNFSVFVFYKVVGVFFVIEKLSFACIMNEYGIVADEICMEDLDLEVIGDFGSGKTNDLDCFNYSISFVEKQDFIAGFKFASRYPFVGKCNIIGVFGN